VVEDKESFAENPPGLEDFWEKIKQRGFARFGDSSGVQNYEIWQGLFR
jgi:hypothetical protein